MEERIWPSNVARVASWDELAGSHFSGTVNALAWTRTLDGDFEEIVQQLTLREDITEVTETELLALELTEAGARARKHILDDLANLTAVGAQPTLNLLKCYARDDEFDLLSTDVYSWHVDRAPVPTATWLCTYYGACSKVLPNEFAIPKVELPEVRAKLLEYFEGQPADFADFVRENYFDLHYQALDETQAVRMRNGELWRLAVDHPDQKVLPCVHAAPVENPGELRLLVIC